jgi:hypothetical protein
MPHVGLAPILFLLLSGVFAAEPPAAAKAGPPADATPYDWGVAYYCPYDNDLERAAPIILKRIRAGITSGRQAAALQADLCDTAGMRRYGITDRGVAETRVDSEDSADEEQAIAYLDWFVKTYPCRRYAFVFLNHGGMLDQMGRDDQPPAPKTAPAWMSGRVLGEKLRALTRRMPGRCELLFFQQCGRGSLENLYSFRETAAFVLASPLNVGAPNTYYTALHRWLGTHPEATGDQLATLIAAEDKDYTTYACVRGPRLSDLPKQLDAVLIPFAKLPALAAPEAPPAAYTCDDESTRDALACLDRLADANRAGADEVAAFRKWVRQELLAGVWYSKSATEQARRLCAGTALFLPADVGEAERYQGLDLYRQSTLGAFWRKLHPRK